MQHSSILHRLAGAALCALVLVFSAVFLLHHLAQEPLQDYDEATYAEEVHEALVNHHYVSFTYAGAPDFKKPPLSFWTMLASESLLGETTFAERLPFVIFGLLLILSVMLVVYEASNDALAAALGGGILASLSPFIMTAREVRMDAVVALCIMLTLYSALRTLQNSRWWVGAGVMLGLAVLAKSVIALFGGVAVLAFVALFKRWNIFKDKNFYYGAAAFLLVALPWHLYEWAKFGNQFWASYLGQEVIERTQVNLFWTVTLTNADYIQFLQTFTQPWLALFFAALVVTLVLWKWIPQTNRKVVFVSAVTIASMVVVFFISKTKAPTYLIPLYPFGAVAIALAFASLKNNYLYYAALVVAAVLVVHSAWFAYYNAYYQNPYFSVVRDMARDEYRIAEIIRPVPKTEPVYVYDDDNLGTIMYYAQHFPLIGLSATTTAQPGQYVIVDTASIPDFANKFPRLSTEVTYQGPQVTLFEVLGED